MIEQIGGFIGMIAADVRNFFRGRQAVPCTVDWRNEYPEFASYIDPDNQLPDEFFDELANGGFINGDIDPKYLNTLDDGCGTCDTDCCVTTDLPTEWKEWNQR